MKKSLVKNLVLGVYRIFWKKRVGGGSSVASVGQTHNGSRWYSPSNWVTTKEDKTVMSEDWSDVKKVELIEKQKKN